MAEEETPINVPEGRARPERDSTHTGTDDDGADGRSVIEASRPADEHQQPLIETDGDELRSPALPYPVVGIGASTSGVEACQRMLEQLSPDTGMAFVLIWDRASAQGADVVSLLQPHTKMPVRQITEGERPLANHVFVIPPGQNARLEGGVFRLYQPETQDGNPAPVNGFFRSLADDQRNLSVGVILSGSDGDGAEGLKTIKGEGGFSLVQSPESAGQTSMPRISIISDHVDLIQPPAGLAHELERLAQQFTKPEVRSLEEGRTPEGEERSFQRILQLLRHQSGLELSQYKPQTIKRRMARRMVLLRIDTMAEYHRHLQGRPDEVHALQEDILINVTRFFRDPEFWEALRTQVLPSLTNDRPPSSTIRVWCAGCSTGEEAYSLAVTILEYISNNNLDTTVQVFGTDASERSIDSARAAIYPDTIANDITPERLRRYFLKVDEGYQVSKRVRDVCIFARHNLCSDPPFSHMNIVSCRNVMIYFNQSLQRQIVSTFHYALEPGGYMLLGSSEGLRDYGDAFFPVDRKQKIYTKNGGMNRANFSAPREYRLSPANTSGDSSLLDNNEMWRETDLQRAADRIVLARYGPPALIVDERMDVLQSRGQTSPLIQISPGAVSWNLSRVLRLDIANQVRETVQRAIDGNIPVSNTLETFDDTDGKQTFNLDVLPIFPAGPRQRCFLLLFQPVQDGTVPKPGSVKQHVTADATEDEKDRNIAQMRRDLNSTRFHLQSLLEERDSRNQELVSANEEIQSANEELQSTNEELETTKEELQSTNEELQTVNDELQQRNAALEQTGNDLRNLLNSINIPLLMLTSDLHIRQFTPPMQKLISLLPNDVGRPTSDIRLQLSIENLEPLLREVSETLVTHESEVQDRNGRWHLLRIRPYRTSDNKIEGLVLVLIDIDQLRKTQQGLVEARDFSRTVVESVPVPVLVLNQFCSIQTVNTAFRELIGMQTDELIGRSLPDLLQHAWGITDLEPRLVQLLADQEGSTFVFEHESTTSDKRVLLVRGQCLAGEGSRVLLLVLEDITARRQADRALRKEREILAGEVESSALELRRTQQELRSLTAHLFTAQEEERQRVARELHDDIGQRLSFLNLLLTSIESAKLDEEQSEKLQSAGQHLQSLSTDVRNMSHHLHPAILDDLGLSAALKTLVTEFGEREGMPATYIGRNVSVLPSQPAITAVYRITQEALRNVAKHAGITHVKVNLEARDGVLHLEIRDFGVGFDTAGTDGPRQGLGTITMKERARLAHGTLSISSALGMGTTVTADIPYRDA